MTLTLSNCTQPEYFWWKLPCSNRTTSLLLVCGIRLKIWSQLVSTFGMDGQTQYSVCSTPPQLFLNMALFNSRVIPEIDKLRRLNDIEFVNLYLAWVFFGKSCLAPLGQPHFCLLVGLDFRYEVSLHQFQVRTAKQYSVRSTPPQLSLNMALSKSRDW